MQKLSIAFLLLVFTVTCSFAQSGTKYILLEEFSTAQCGFCPDGDVIAAQIIEDHPTVIWVTHHSGFGVDAMTVDESVPIANDFTTFAPAGLIDRGDYPIPVYTIPPFIGVSRQKWDSIVEAHLGDPAVVDITITNVYDPVTRLLDCTVDGHFLSAPTPGDLRLNLFLSEDSVVGYGEGYDQTNYFNTTVGHEYYGAGDPIVGYVHHHVLRDVETGDWGMEGLIAEAPAADDVFTYTFTDIPIDTNWKAEDMDVIAFVGYYNNDTHLRQVINSNHKALTDSTVETTSIEQLKPAFSISPNPATAVLQISGLQADENTFAEIYNQQGELIMRKKINTSSVEIDISECVSGIYFTVIKNNRGSAQLKFLKL